MYLEDAIARLLRSAPVAGIDFNLNGLHISGEGFDRIAQLIADGHIRVRVDTEMCVGAQYDPSYNNPDTLFLPNAQVSNPRTQMFIVHEATHALCDLMRSSGYVYVDESAAFLAEVTFSRRVRPPIDLQRWLRPRSRQPERCNVDQDAMRDEINRHRRAAGRRPIPRNRPFNQGARIRVYSAANTLVSRHRLHREMENRPMLTWDQFAALRNAIASTESFEYIHRPRTPGGPPYRYTNDGIRRAPGTRPAHEYEAL